jgi:hypothetical protein
MKALLKRNKRSVDFAKTTAASVLKNPFADADQTGESIGRHARRSKTTVVTHRAPLLSDNAGRRVEAIFTCARRIAVAKGGEAPVKIPYIKRNQTEAA